METANGMKEQHPHLFGVPHPRFASRREFLQRTGSGFGMLALASLLGEEAAAAVTSPPNVGGQGGRNPLASKPGHFPVKAKNVIWLFMNGGPSQVDTWDYKPPLEKHDGKELPGFDKNTGFFTE